MKTYDEPCDCDDPVAHDASMHALADTLAQPERHPVFFADFRMACRGESDMIKGVRHWSAAVREKVTLPDGVIASFDTQRFESGKFTKTQPEDMPGEFIWATRLLVCVLNDDFEMFHALINSEREISQKRLHSGLSMYLYMAANTIKDGIDVGMFAMQTI